MPCQMIRFADLKRRIRNGQTESPGYLSGRGKIPLGRLKSKGNNKYTKDASSQTRTDLCRTKPTLVRASQSSRTSLFGSSGLIRILLSPCTYFAPTHFPFLLYADTTRLGSLEQAKANASYSVYVPDNDPEVNIPIAGGVEGRVIRVQLEGTGYLSISELQAYELSFLPLSK